MVFLVLIVPNLVSSCSIKLSSSVFSLKPEKESLFIVLHDNPND